MSSSNLFLPLCAKLSFYGRFVYVRNQVPNKVQMFICCLSQVSVICNCLLSLHRSIPCLRDAAATDHLSCLLSHVLTLSKDPVASWVLSSGSLRVSTRRSGAGPHEKFFKVTWPCHSMTSHHVLREDREHICKMSLSGAMFVSDTRESACFSYEPSERTIPWLLSHLGIKLIFCKSC